MRLYRILCLCGFRARLFKPEPLQAFTKFLWGAPDEMDAFAQFLPSERGRRLKIDVCYGGDPQMGNDLVRPMRAHKPQDDSVKVMSYLQAQVAGGFLLTPVANCSPRPTSTPRPHSIQFA
jgi:hypothetical protein